MAILQQRRLPLIMFVCLSNAEPPTVNITQTTLRPFINGSVTLYCSAVSESTFPDSIPANLRPSLDYKWSRVDGKPLTSRHRIGGVRRNVLTVYRVAKEDIGTSYKCSVSERPLGLKTEKIVHLINKSELFVMSNFDTCISTTRTFIARRVKSRVYCCISCGIIIIQSSC